MKKSNLIKSALLSVVFVFTLASSLFATGNDVKENKETATTTTIKLSVEELALEAALDAELDIEIDEVLASLENTVENIFVYNQVGQLVDSQEVANGKVDLNVIQNADLLMTDGTTQYYLLNE